MADKRGKHTKHIDRDQKETPETDSKKINVSDAFFGELKDAFTAFDKLPELKRAELYGNQEYLEQFREYFKIEHPSLLDKIDKKDLPVYIQALENTGFSIGHILDKTGKLHEEFKAEDTEHHVMEQSLEQLQKFCEDKNNNISEGTFKKFADVAGFDAVKFELSPDGKLKIIDHLYLVWKDFLKKESIKIDDVSAERAERILTPNYNPTERVMVTVAITKMKKELKGTLRTAFDAQFPLPLTIFSSHQDLINFRDELKTFLDDHAAEIDESLAKKLDSVIVTNSDIQKELLKGGRKFDDTKGFSEREQYFRRIFNKLVTRQLFEEVKKTQETIDHYVTAMADTFKQFPPYVNEILNMDMYRFNAKTISTIDTSFDADLEHIDLQISECNKQFIAVTTDEERQQLRKKMKLLKQQREERKWEAYIAFLRTKNTALADIFAKLVASKFDFSVLSADHQQLLVDILVKNKLEDTIKNNVPELLSVKEEELTQFIHDLFDLKKMDIIIPTIDGPVPLTFLKKEFLASVPKQLPGIGNLNRDIKNLPLNFITQLTDSNSAFFEDSEIFRSIYTDFASKKGKFRINDAYRVKIKKEGKIVEGYLSSYCPIDEKYNDKDYKGKELFLYSKPITAPNQERNLVTRPHDEGKSEIPVVIKDNEQKDCEMEILDKKINLNGEAFGALLFGYVLGQQSRNTSMSPEKEEELAKKIGDLKVYKEKVEGEEEEIQPVTETPEKNKEDSEREKFNNERKQLKGYGFPEEQYKENFGFVKGARLFIPHTDSVVPPVESGKSWLEMEITHIDEKKGTFTVKFRGGELSLGKSEGVSRELPINAESIRGIKKVFGDDVYKFPDVSKIGFEQQMDMLTSGSVTKDLDKYFGSLKLEGSTFKYSLGDYKDQEITHFGLYQPKAIGESLDTESGRTILYKIKFNANGTINVSGDSLDGNYAKNFPARDMDYATFMLFVKEKGLQPKCKEQMKAITAKAVEDKEVPRTVRGFSISNVIGFFKNGMSKIKDGIKKYDEERSEDLTDLLTHQGKLWGNIGGFLSPFSRISSSFESMGNEYRLERDNRIWKKVEKRTKFYEDFDYSQLYKDVIEPMLSGKIAIVPHYKIAAILLVHIKKGKGPYAKNLSTTGGDWIGKLLGADHQQRYLAIREKKIKDLEQNAHLYPVSWADDIKNQLVELEMRYIVHVMDGREMGVNDNDKTKLYFQDKYSKKFCDELETAYTGFYKHNTVEEGFTKAQDNNFEFARVEYFRLLADRPEQALPFLKVMATKAISTTQWQVFETAVLAGILSGVFLTMTYSSTQSFIQKICRTRGFVPGIFAKDVKQQFKAQRILDLFSNNSFTKETSYSPTDYSFRYNKGPGDFIKSFIKRTDTLDKNGSPIRNSLSKFLSLEGKDIEKKHTLLDLYSATETSMSDKLILEEYIGKTNEKDEELDPDVTKNTSSLTGSILTKSQSVVEKMIKFDNGGFAGKDGDEKQNMKAFSKNMQDAIPKNKIDSSDQIKFFVKKFFNRFGERGFSGTKMTDFLKRLKWCKENKGSPEVEDILFYSTVGEIISSLAGNNATPPDELMGALGAWKDFFRKNLDNILQPDVITSCFGGAQYKADYDKSTSKLEPRETASVLLDREDSPMYMYSLPTKELKAEATAKKRELSNENKYLNKKLYTLADGLYRKCSGFPNRFKKDVNKIKKTSVQTTAKATGARINNPQMIEKVRRILEGKPPEEETPDEMIYEEPEDYDY